MTFKERLIQYRFIKNEIRTGASLDPERAQAEMKDIERTVASIPDARVRQAIFMRYLAPARYSWDETAAVVHYSEGRIRALVREELKRIG